MGGRRKSIARRPRIDKQNPAQRPGQLHCRGQAGEISADNDSLE